MSAAREQLLQRFRATAIERLRRLGLSLLEHEMGSPAQPLPESVRRDLHTLKGESRMLGLHAVSNFIHRIEELLQPTSPEGGFLSAQAIQVARRGVDQLIQGLSDAPLNDAALQGVLVPLQAELLLTQDPPVSSDTAPPPVKTAAGAGPPAPPLEPGAAEQRWVHVDMQRIDDVCDSTAELETSFRTLFAQARSIFAQRTPSPNAMRALREDFERCHAQFDAVTSMVWALRLVPVEPMLAQLGKHAYDLARGQGKRILLRIQSGSAQLERSILDALWEPLLHLVRNAIDHGIEPPAERGEKAAEATLALSAESHGATVTLTVSDDGRGIDLGAVRAAAIERGILTPATAAASSEADLHTLLFRHGFSTRSQVTDLSGRGVGLDVVHRAVESVGGTIALVSAVGRGATFRLSLPVRLSRERALVFGRKDTLFAIPARQVLDLVNLREQTVRPVAGGSAIWSRHGVLPLYSIAAALGGDGAHTADEPLVIILSTGTQRWAFTIGGIVGEFELIRKPCDALLTACMGFTASAVLDDGRLVMYLNPAELVQRAQSNASHYAHKPPPRPRRVLVVDDSVIIRQLLSLVLGASGYAVVTADNGRHGLAVCEEELPDIILCDLDMPEMDGMEMLQKVRARWHALPVIIFTNHSSVELKQRAQALGANEYVVKAEFNQEILLHAVQRVLGPAGERGA